MKVELDNFIIESDIELDYFDEVVSHVIENEKRILDFFELEKLPQKCKILILSYEPFKEFITSKYGEILDYMRGDTDPRTNTIRLLNISDQIKYTSHKNANIDQLKGTILHEIVHQCHQVYHHVFNQTIWFAEGLATNLSNQPYKIVDLNRCDFESLKRDFNHYNDGYVFAYTITNYILNNYPHEEIVKLYSDPDYLRERADKLFEEARVLTNKTGITR